MPVLKTDKTNKAMKAYLERATAHDEFMQIQSHGFRIGKRHLANMMGEDPETFSQNDIDVSQSE
jgi:small subunit ribosomal protein S9